MGHSCNTEWVLLKKLVYQFKVIFRPEWDPEVSEICRLAGWGIEQYGSLELANELRG